MIITHDNIEELILLYIDKELDEVQAENLMLFVQKHPEYKKMLDDYEMTVMQDEEFFVFENKASLKKQLKIRSRKNYKVWMAAASLLLACITCIWFLFHDRKINNNDDIKPSTVVKNNADTNHKSYVSNQEDTVDNNATIVKAVKTGIKTERNKQQAVTKIDTIPTSSHLPQSTDEHHNTIAETPAVSPLNIDTISDVLPTLPPQPLPQLANNVKPSVDAPIASVQSPPRIKGVVGGLIRAGNRLQKSDGKTVILVTIGGFNKKKDYLITLNF